jgi:GTP-binding protein
VEDSQEILICKGGRGGRGNARFANSREQTPRFAEKGEPGQEMTIKRLKLIADIRI